MSQVVIAQFVTFLRIMMRAGRYGLSNIPNGVPSWEWSNSPCKHQRFTMELLPILNEFSNPLAKLKQTKTKSHMRCTFENIYCAELKSHWKFSPACGNKEQYQLKILIIPYINIHLALQVPHNWLCGSIRIHFQDSDASCVSWLAMYYFLPRHLFACSFVIHSLLLSCVMCLHQDLGEKCTVSIKYLYFFCFVMFMFLGLSKRIN